jgi:hypothetical protein
MRAGVGNVGRSRANRLDPDGLRPPLRHAEPIVERQDRLTCFERCDEAALVANLARLKVDRQFVSLALLRASRDRVDVHRDCRDAVVRAVCGEDVGEGCGENGAEAALAQRSSRIWHASRSIKPRHAELQFLFSRAARRTIDRSESQGHFT